MQVIQRLQGNPDAPTVMLELVLSQANIDELVADTEHRGFLAKQMNDQFICMVRVEANELHYPAAWNQPVLIEVPGGRG